MELCSKPRGRQMSQEAFEVHQGKDNNSYNIHWLPWVWVERSKEI